MGMSRQGREDAIRALRNHRRFQNSTGSFFATTGSTRALGWLANHPQKQAIQRMLGLASYVVWSYSTPLGWVIEDDDGDFTRYYVDEQHTVTTSHHQGILRVAWGEYETIGVRPERRPPARRPVNQETILAPAAVEAEDRQRASLAAMLDPRYRDPDWTPWTRNGSNLPPGAEDRDYERVEQTGGPRL